MGWDHEKEAAKRSELLGTLKGALVEHGVPQESADSLAPLVFDAYITTSPPEKEQVVMHLMTMYNDGQGGGKSVKPGNIKLNLGKLTDALAAGALTAMGLPDNHIAILLAALIMWRSLWGSAEIRISENEAAVLYVMWMHKDAEHEVPDDDLLNKCNQHLQKYSRPLLSQRDIKLALETLERIGTIKRSRLRPKLWWLCEWVQPIYR